jgi:hypothetical protein
MAGRARTKALTEALQRRAIETLSEDETHAPSMLDYVCDCVESGQTLKELALDLTTELEQEVTYARLMAVLRAEHGDDAAETRLEASRKRASHWMAEDAVSLVDAPADTNVDVSRAASRARTRQWLAERWNRQGYGQQSGVSVNVTVGSLHLDALRAVPARATATIVSPATPQLPASTADAQVIDTE